LKSVAERLKEARTEKGVSVKEMATACEISESAIQMYECGQRIPRDNIKIVIADYLNKRVQDLFF
jgi:transcriptional regulator with XRE-family HTH domain